MLPMGRRKKIFINFRGLDMKISKLSEIMLLSGMAKDTALFGRMGFSEIYTNFYLQSFAKSG
jgi:hypothetical protein